MRAALQRMASSAEEVPDHMCALRTAGQRQQEARDVLHQTLRQSSQSACRTSGPRIPDASATNRSPRPRSLRRATVSTNTDTKTKPHRGVQAVLQVRPMSDMRSMVRHTQHRRHMLARVPIRTAPHRTPSKPWQAQGTPTERLRCRRLPQAGLRTRRLPLPPMSQEDTTRQASATPEVADHRPRHSSCGWRNTRTAELSHCVLPLQFEEISRRRWRANAADRITTGQGIG